MIGQTSLGAGDDWTDLFRGRGIQGAICAGIHGSIRAKLNRQTSVEWTTLGEASQEAVWYVSRGGGKRVCRNGIEDGTSSSAMRGWRASADG